MSRVTPTDTSEGGLEALITRSLVNGTKYLQGDPQDYDREHAVFASPGGLPRRGQRRTASNSCSLCSIRPHLGVSRVGWWPRSSGTGASWIETRLGPSFAGLILFLGL